MSYPHSWAPASRRMPPASELQHLSPYSSIPVPDRVAKLQFLTGSGIGISVHSDTGPTGCQTVWHSGI